jgi:hypothetical protein
MTPAPAPETFALVLKALPWSTPAVVRLRRLLKCALRSFGLRCIDVRLVGPDPDADGRPAVPVASDTPFSEEVGHAP